MAISVHLSAKTNGTLDWLNADRRKLHPEIPDLWMDTWDHLNLEAGTERGPLNHPHLVMVRPTHVATGATRT
jgi:hypothetical protein